MRVVICVIAYAYIHSAEQLNGYEILSVGKSHNTLKA